MTKIIINRFHCFSYFLVAIITCCALNLSCSKADSIINTRELVVYPASGTASYNAMGGTFVILRKDIVAGAGMAFPALISRPFDQDVKVTAIIDTALISAYDSTYKTVSYRFNFKHFKLLNETITIKAGQISSFDSITISLNDTAGIDITKTYIIPIKLNSSTIVPISGNRNVMYLKLSFIKAVSSISISGNNKANIDFAKSPSGNIFGPSQASFGASINTTVKTNVDVSIIADESLVESYNSTNGTNYKQFPAGTYSLIKDKVNIEAGAITSAQDSFRLQFSNTSSFQIDDTYILPLRIKDEGVVNVGTNNIVYIIVRMGLSNVDPSNSGLIGATMNRTIWSATVSSSFFANVGSNVLDGNNSTAWDSNDGLPEWLVLNMGDIKTVKGFNIVPNYFFTPDDFLNMDIFSSNDGVTWTKQGTYSGTPTASSSSSSSPDIKVVKFIEPITAKYFRFLITESTDGRYTGMGELNGVE